jgi:hypothetical protein
MLYNVDSTLVIEATAPSLELVQNKAPSYVPLVIAEWLAPIIGHDGGVVCSPVIMSAVVWKCLALAVDATAISEDAKLIELNKASASLANMIFYSRECRVDIGWVLRTSVAGETILCLLIRWYMCSGGGRRCVSPPLVSIGPGGPGRSVPRTTGVEVRRFSKYY